MSFASAIYQLFPVSSRMGHLFLNPSCPARFAAAVEDARQRHMVAIYARKISKFWILYFHAPHSAVWDWTKTVQGSE
jgi:hypothetical protein